MSEKVKPYQCNMCKNMGLRQFCYEHKTYHRHGMVHLDKEYKGMKAWWLCNVCAERER